MYVHYQPTLETVDGRKEKEISIIVIILNYEYLHWDVNQSTLESFHTSLPTPSMVSQLECLCTISNTELPA